MIKLLIWGINGFMGKLVKGTAEADGGFEILGGVDAVAGPGVVTDWKKLPTGADVVIDFSRAAALDGVLSYALANRSAVLLASTGYDEAQSKRIESAAAQIAIIKSGNLSIGVNLMTKLVEAAASALGTGFDVEIVEAHHRRKVDSPSGTALMLVDAAKRGRADLDETVYGRHSPDQAREANEIGVHAIRGGTIVGEHSVIFAGSDEIIEIKHTALSRAIFAHGAIKAAKKLSELPPALYSMTEILG